MTTKCQVISNWYLVNEIAPDVFWIKEPGLVSFYLFKSNNRGLFIDSGLGLSEKAFIDLLSHLGIHEYEVICTHAHSDHIGLNSFASSCKLSKIEWEKYLRLNEFRQLDYFLEYLAVSNSTPSILNESENKIIGNLKWNPNGFLKQGDTYQFHEWSFDVIEAPGHTSGSLIFHEKNLNFIFVGDLVYSGTMYLHLKDSNFEDFRDSLDLLLNLVKVNADVKIWPAHNCIPLDLNFISKTRMVLDLIHQGHISSIQDIPKDKIFEEGQLYIHESVKLIMRSIC